MSEPAAPSRSTSLTIGAFSRLCRLSLKALRLYDALGLLEPHHTDEQSGYRYYDPAQLERARLIGWLRQLDLPLPTIAQLLDAPPNERGELFRQLWQAIEAAHIQRRGLAEYVMQHFSSPEQRSHTMIQTAPPTFKLEQRFVPEQPVVSMTRRVYVSDLPAFFEDSARVLAFVEAQGAQVSGPMFAVFHGQVNTDSDGPVEICFPYSGDLVAEGEFALRREPAHHEAYVTLTKAQFVFPQILSAYDAAHGLATQLGDVRSAVAA